MWLSNIHEQLIVLRRDFGAFRIKALDFNSDRGGAREVVAFLRSLLFCLLLLFFLSLHQLLVLRGTLARNPLILNLVYVDYVLLHELFLQHGVLLFRGTQSNRAVYLSFCLVNVHRLAERSGIYQVCRPHLVL